MDTPQELAFASAIGRAEGFSPPDSTDAPVGSVLSDVEREWRAWWERLLTDNMSIGMDRALSDAPRPLTPDAFAAVVRIARPETTWDPPTFASLADWPALRSICQRLWPAFQSTWDRVDGEKMALADALSVSNRRLHLNQIVYHCVKAAGKRVCAPFKLRLDITPWPEDYRRRISDEHAIIGAGYLAAERADAWRALLASYIIRLV